MIPSLLHIVWILTFTIKYFRLLAKYVRESSDLLSYHKQECEARSKILVFVPFIAYYGI